MFDSMIYLANTYRILSIVNDTFIKVRIEMGFQYHMRSHVQYVKSEIYFLVARIHSICGSMKVNITLKLRKNSCTQAQCTNSWFTYIPKTQSSSGMCYIIIECICLRTLYKKWLNQIDMNLQKHIFLLYSSFSHNHLKIESLNLYKILEYREQMQTQTCISRNNERKYLKRATVNI